MKKYCVFYKELDKIEEKTFKSKSGLKSRKKLKKKISISRPKKYPDCKSNFCGFEIEICFFVKRK